MRIKYRERTRRKNRVQQEGRKTKISCQKEEADEVLPGQLSIKQFFEKGEKEHKDLSSSGWIDVSSSWSYRFLKLFVLRRFSLSCSVQCNKTQINSNYLNSHSHINNNKVYRRYPNSFTSLVFLLSLLSCSHMKRSSAASSSSSPSSSSSLNDRGAVSTDSYSAADIQRPASSPPPYLPSFLAVLHLAPGPSPSSAPSSPAHVARPSPALLHQPILSSLRPPRLRLPLLLLLLLPTLLPLLPRLHLLRLLQLRVTSSCIRHLQLRAATCKQMKRVVFSVLIVHP